MTCVLVDGSFEAEDTRVYVRCKFEPGPWETLEISEYLRRLAALRTPYDVNEWSP